MLEQFQIRFSLMVSVICIAALAAAITARVANSSELPLVNIEATE